VWGYWHTIADTDVDTNVAWLDPEHYVLASGHSLHHESNVPSYSLKVYTTGYEWGGSRTFWSGSMLDAGVSGAIWADAVAGS
jgi:hypothetical protein